MTQTICDNMVPFDSSDGFEEEEIQANKCGHGLRIIAILANTEIVSTYLVKFITKLNTLDYLLAEQDQISAQGWNFS